jgi:hypothetical protein
MERCCSRLLELDHGGFNTTHPFGGPGSYDRFKEVINGVLYWGKGDRMLKQPSTLVGFFRKKLKRNNQVTSEGQHLACVAGWRM